MCVFHMHFRTFPNHIQTYPHLSIPTHMYPNLASPIHFPKNTKCVFVFQYIFEYFPITSKHIHTFHSNSTGTNICPVQPTPRKHYICALFSIDFRIFPNHIHILPHLSIPTHMYPNLSSPIPIYKNTSPKPPDEKFRSFRGVTPKPVEEKFRSCREVTLNPYRRNSKVSVR
jgi:hypothetical protein